MKKELRKMPKVELHLHFDGSVSIELLAYLSKLPRGEILKKTISIRDKNLEEYLKHFDFINNYLQTKENLELAGYDLGQSLDRENVIYAEVRFAPLSHINNGLSLDDVILSIKEGLSKCKVKTNLILCLRRGASLEDNRKVIDLANRYLGKGVVAVDLVGDEENYPFKDYEYLFNVCKYANIPVTIHAGEVTKRDILDVINYTKRIGHGIKIYDDDKLINEVKKKGILLEVCPNSNVDTMVIKDYKNHPIKELYDKDVKVCVNTDNRTVSDVTLTREYEDLIKEIGFTMDDLIKMNLNAVDGAFITDKEKDELKKQIISYKKNESI